MVHEGRLDASGFKFAVVVARFNSFVTERLLEGALDALKRHGAEDAAIDIFRVPGAFEIPLAATLLAEKKGYRCDYLPRSGNKRWNTPFSLRGFGSHERHSSCVTGQQEADCFWNTYNGDCGAGGRAGRHQGREQGV
jgi:hypothetical protein